MLIENSTKVVITPVYEDSLSSASLFKEIKREVRDNLFILAIDDGSVCSPLTLGDLTGSGVDGAILKVKRNVGHQKAIQIGLKFLCEAVPASRLASVSIVIMDSDGEDKPTEVTKLLQVLNTDKDADVVLAVRGRRAEPIWFRSFYQIYKVVFRILTGRAISFGNFMAMNGESAARLASMYETSIHLAAAVLASKLRVTRVVIDRGVRYAGDSKMNFVGLVLHGFRAINVFAEDVLVRVGLGCAFVATLSILGALTAVALKLAGYSTPGWFSVVVGILALIFIQTGALAIMLLMITGASRSSNLSSAVDGQEFVSEVLSAHSEK